MLDIENLNVHIMGMHIIKGVSVKIAKGEFVSLIGANGAGKSTLMRSVVGLRSITDGVISLDGEVINNQRPDLICQKNIALVPEGRCLFGEMSVEENLEMGAFSYRKESARIKKNLQKMYDMFPVLGKYRTRAAKTFSGGEQQMVTIARGLMSEPHILLVDELSLGLAPKIVTMLLEVLRRLNEEEGIGILLVEQNAAQALKYSQRGYVLDNGRIVLEGSSSNLLNDPEVRKAYVGI